jgi:hypothetical protein
MQVDGFQESSNWSNNGACWDKILNTARFPNGPREIFVSSIPNEAGVPVFTSTFTSGGVSGTNITSDWHKLITNRPVALSTTGTLPSCSGAGCSVSPLQAGVQWFGTGSGATNTFSAGCASGTCTFTTSSAHGLSAGNRVSVAIVIQSLSGNKYNLIPLNGSWTVLASPAPTSTTFAISVPGMVGNDGTYGTNYAQLITNPYYPAYVDNNTFTLAESLNGTPITLLAAGPALTRLATK